MKYDMNKDAGTMVVDRVLYTAMRYPGNYGFVPHTLSDDSDPVDALIADHRPLLPGSVINCKVIGVLHMVDEAGADEKIIAVPSSKVPQIYAKVNSIHDLPEIQLKQIAHFFERYKDLEGEKWVKIDVGVMPTRPAKLSSRQ